MAAPLHSFFRFNFAATMFRGTALRIGLAVSGLTLPRLTSAATAQIDAASTQQLIRGFGGATVFVPTTPLTGGDLDTLFLNGSGQLGFTVLRIRVSTDANWRALELTNAKGAMARGAIVMATPWSPPAAMKSNNNLVAGSLNPSAYAAYATYLNDFAKYMADGGAPLYAISVQNEPDIDVTYESCDWTAAQMLDFCKNYAGAITTTRVIAPESFQFRRSMSDPLLNDAAAAANIDIVGGHIYGGGLAAYPLAAAKGKEVWMTEHLDLSTDWAGALATGKEIHDCLATANFSAYIWWYLRRYYGPLGEDSIVTKRGWVMAQFSKFIRPGYVRVDATGSPAAGVFVSAYKRDRLVIVAINQNAAPVTQVFSLTNATVKAMSPWTTSSTANLEAQAAIAVGSGTFTAMLPAQSITTFVGDIVPAAPAIVTPPQSRTLATGSTVVFDVAATGDLLTYQWLKNGSPIVGAMDAALTLTNVAAADAGDYAVTVSNASGTATSAAGTLSVAVTNDPGRLVNISTRSLVGTGDNVQIAGFVITGTEPKAVLVRAAGPALATGFGLTGVLADPVVEVREAATGNLKASNDNWDASLEATFTAVGAFTWTRGSKDAATLVTLPPGSYSAIVRGNDGGSGMAIVEVYDADRGLSSTVINISTRSIVATGDNVQIAGFVLAGSTARTVVVRAAGPALHKLFGLGGTLEDPAIELRRMGQAEPLAVSDDWSAKLGADFTRVGAFPWPAETRDAALVATLAPGGYSVVVHGKGTNTGLAIVEVYAEP